MDINLGLIFGVAFTVLLLVFILLCLLGRKTKARWLVLFGNTLRFLCLQGLLGLAFLFLYVSFVKNGIDLSLSALGVAFIPFTVGAYFWAWHQGVLSASAYSLYLPLAYSLFLLWRLFNSAGVFSYLAFNPAFGFIGSHLQGTGLFPLSGISALLPFLCAVIGRGLGVKTIDKR